MNGPIFLSFGQVLNSLPYNKILSMSKLQACTHSKINVAKMMISLSDTPENTVGKEENAGYQHFLLFPQSFPKQLLDGGGGGVLCL